jgi:hypothetical protein
MNVAIGTEAPIFLFWEYLFQIFGILSLQCTSVDMAPTPAHPCGYGTCTNLPTIVDMVYKLPTSADMAHERAQGTENQAVALRGQEGKKEKHTYSLLPPCPEARQSGKRTVRKTWGKNLRDVQHHFKNFARILIYICEEIFPQMGLCS